MRYAPRRKGILLASSLLFLLSIPGLAWLAKHRVRQESLNHNLIVALRSKDIVKARLLLDQGADPNARERGASPPVRFVDLWKLLWRPLQKESATAGEPALMIAAGDLEAMQLLLDRGADVDARSSGGDTLLLGMSGFSQTSGCTCQLLLDGTALKGIRLLLDRGANINVRDSYGMTPLMRYASGTSEDLPDKPVFHLLLARGTDVNVQDKGGETALFYALWSGGRIEEIKSLISHGANVNLQDNEGRTALMVAEQPDIVNILLTHGANANLKDKKGQTALMLAAGEDNDEKVKLLLDHDADVNARDHQGRTALMHEVAAERNVEPYDPPDTKGEVIKALLARGADVHAKDNAGMTALKIAETTGNKSRIPLLKQVKNLPGHTQ